MAKIIEFSSEVNKRFYKWVSQYVSSDGKEITDFAIETLLYFLIENDVFTVDDLFNELKKCHIPLPAKYISLVNDYAVALGKKQYERRGE